MPSAPTATASADDAASLVVEEPRGLGAGNAIAWTDGTITIADGPDMVLVDETTLVERERVAAASWHAPPESKWVDPNFVRLPADPRERGGHALAAVSSPDGTRVAVKTDEGALVVVSLDGKVVSGPAFVRRTAVSSAVAWAPGVVATAGLGCEVHLVRADRVDLLPASKATQACGLALSPDATRLLVGRQIFVGSRADAVELYDADKLTRLSGWDLGNDDDQHYVAWPATGGDGGVHLWQPPATATAAVPVYSIAVSPDGKLVATTSYEENTVRLWEAPSLAPRSTAFDFKDGGQVAFAGAGTLIIDRTGALTAVSVATGAVRWEVDLGVIVTGLAASEDVVVVTSNRGGFFRLDARTGRVVVREPSLNGRALALLPGGKVAHLGVDRAIRVLTADAKELARILPVRGSAGAWVIADGAFERIGDPGKELMCRASGKVVPLARCASLERHGLLTDLLSAETRALH